MFVVIRRQCINLWGVFLGATCLMNRQGSVVGLEYKRAYRSSPENRSLADIRDSTGGPFTGHDATIDQARIIGGHKAEEGEFPGIVALVSRSSTQFCSGTLLTENYVVTAAHCLNCFERKASYIRVVAGTLDPNNFYGRSPHEQERWGKHFYVHPNYSGRRSNRECFLMMFPDLIASYPQEDPEEHFGSSESHSSEKNVYDFGILEVEEPFILDGKYVATVPLHHFNGSLEWLDKQANSGKVICIVAGWGIIQPHRIADIPIGLQQTRLKLMPHDFCEEKYIIFDRTAHVCAYEDHTDACQGDSGGPMFCEFEADQPPMYTGVISWGLGCARPANPGVFARLDVGEPWIRALTDGVGDGNGSRNGSIQPATKTTGLQLATILFCLSVS